MGHFLGWVGFRTSRIDAFPFWRSGATPWENYLAIYAAFLGMQVLDMASTVAVIRQGGSESAAVAANLLGQHGVVALLALKIALALLTLAVWSPAVSYLARGSAPRWALPTVFGMLLGLTGFYSGVVFYNLVNLHILLGR